MTLRIASIHGPGELDGEYLMLWAEADCDLGDFLVADTDMAGAKQISTRLGHTYWFPPTPVSKGDTISLWTKAGTNAEATSREGVPVRRFYWGLDEPVWTEGRCAVLLRVAEYWTKQGI